MKKLIMCLALVCSASLWTLAQDSDAKGKSDTRTITGCLAQGDNAKEFKLTAQDGSTWEVRSDAVALGEHVGHTVTATDVVSNAKMHNLKEDAKDAAADTGVKKDTAEHGHLKVTSIHSVGGSCRY